MHTQLIDRIPVASLYPDRYQVSRTKVYAALKTLAIQTVLHDRQAYLSLEDLSVLDEYMKRLSYQGAESAALYAAERQSSVNPSTPQPSPLSRPSQDASQLIPPLLQLVLEALAPRLQPLPLDPLTIQRHLQEISDRGWQVSTAQLRQILGTRPKPGDRYGFRFERTGRIGRQAAWSVKSLDRG
jgi:hypothetical protein